VVGYFAPLPPRRTVKNSNSGTDDNNTSDKIDTSNTSNTSESESTGEIRP